MVAAIFFDLGDTLGVPVLDSSGRLLRFDAFDFSVTILQGLLKKNVRVGVISNTGVEPGTRLKSLLQDAGLYEFFDPGLLVYSHDLGEKRIKNSAKTFRDAAIRAGLGESPERCLFVGEDARERHYAHAAHWKVCPHPLLVEEVLKGQSLQYLRIEVPRQGVDRHWRTALQQLPLLPLHVEGYEGTTLYALTSQRIAGQLMSEQFRVSFLGKADLPLRTELYLLRDDEAKSTGFLNNRDEASKLFIKTESANAVLESADGRILVALSPEVTLDSIHFENARHGHTLRLMPDPHLLDEPEDSANSVEWGMDATAKDAVGISFFTNGEAKAWDAVTAESIQDLVNRFSGQQPLYPGSDKLIRSRHVLHPDNQLAVNALAQEFHDIGHDILKVRLHSFSHLDRTLNNIVAELPGQSSELVLITAHLDSVAMPNSHATGPAPGADDDMSGVAGVLLAAKCILALSANKPLVRTVQFVLFNDEENGLVGSKAYARQLKNAGAHVTGVFQMDMIGYNRKDPRSWEVHVGFSSSSETGLRSLHLAELISKAAISVSPNLPPPQIYGPGVEDPAEQRSDHASFQQYGYPGSCTSEDFFGGPSHNHDAPEPNPNYHKREDLYVDASYAADIARAVGAAAWKLAMISG